MRELCQNPYFPLPLFCNLLSFCFFAKRLSFPPSMQIGQNRFHTCVRFFLLAGIPRLFFFKTRFVGSYYNGQVPKYSRKIFWRRATRLLWGKKENSVVFSPFGRISKLKSSIVENSKKAFVNSILRLLSLLAFKSLSPHIFIFLPPPIPFFSIFFYLTVNVVDLEQELDLVVRGLPGELVHGVDELLNKY